MVSDGDNKKRKLSNEQFEITESQNIFKHLKVDRILRNDSKNKMLVVLGKFSRKADVDEKNAVVLLEKLPFDNDSVAEALTADDGKTEETLKNDIYSTYKVFSSKAVPDCKATMIYPATERHISKYSDHEAFIVRETPHLYHSITQPCLQSSAFDIQWVYNILEKKSESDRIVFEDPDPEIGFILLPDMKWNRSDVNALYLVAIVHRHNISSLRDLRASHLPLLNNILEKGTAEIHRQFGIPSHKLRIYLHYLPSYRHLHVHFTHINLDAPGSDCLRAHTLEDVIDSITMDSEFFVKKTLLYTVRDGDELFTAYKNSGYFDL